MAPPASSVQTIDRGRHSFALFAFGFRPFFLFGAGYAAVAVPAWIAMYAGGRFAPVGHPLQWHAHEMLFGFAGAIIAGFLLTAPANWTGRPMPRGGWLGALFLHWLAGRVLAGCAGVVPGWLYVVVDVSFLPVIAVIVAKSVWTVRQSRNYMSPVLLLLMAGANAMSHTGIRLPNGAAAGTEVMLYLTVFMIALFAGRIFPFFVRSRFPTAAPRKIRLLEWLSLGTLIGFFTADVLVAPSGLIASLAVVAGALHAMRWAGWQVRGMWTEPMLWVLFIGYAWLPVALVLKAISTHGWVNPLVVRHAFAVGCIGTVILGMICRVTMGHTGRPIRASRTTVAAFLLVTASALARVALPIAAPAFYLASLHAAALCWTLSFLLYVFQYSPMLIRPRADGRSG